jgi:hypothetical protein
MRLDLIFKMVTEGSGRKRGGSYCILPYPGLSVYKSAGLSIKRIIDDAWFCWLWIGWRGR